MTEAQLTESKDRPKGPLKITTTVAFGSHWLAARMSEFIEIYPEIECHLLLLDREVDLSMREADLAIRFSPPRQADLVRSEEHTSELQSLMRISYAVFCLKKKKKNHHTSRAQSGTKNIHV